MSPDEREALWRKYSNDVIILLPLESGRIAVFNNARELCGVVDPDGKVPPQCWYPPTPPRKRADFSLEDLGL